MIITNKWLGNLIASVLRRHTTTYSFTYERSFRDDDIIPAQFKANYIHELREHVEEFIAELENQLKQDGGGE